MRNNPSQFSNSPDSSMSSVQISSAEVSMHLREQLLLENLLDPKLEWRIETREDKKNWHCTERDPFLPDPDPFGGMGFDHSMSFGASFPRKGCFGAPLESLTGWDWHKHRTDTLHGSSDDHEITITKTHEDWYRHRLRRGENTVSYQVSFTDREDSTQRFVISGEQSGKLAQIFEQIARRIQ